MAGGDCQLDKFKIRPNMKKSMQQMLQALMNRLGQGDGNGGSGGSGSGSGGTSPNGFASQGHMDHLLPVYGPERMEFGGADLAYGEYGSGKGRSKRRKEVKVSSGLVGANNQSGTGSSQEAVSVPEKYKQAVKTYFTEQPN